MGKQVATLSFIERKMKGDLTPDNQGYAVFQGNGFRAVALKRYAKDDAKPYARWFVAQDLGMGPSYGDTYVSDIVSLSAELVTVDGREPTGDEQGEFFELKRALSQREGGVRIF